MCREGSSATTAISDRAPREKWSRCAVRLLAFALVAWCGHVPMAAEPVLVAAAPAPSDDAQAVMADLSTQLFAALDRDRAQFRADPDQFVLVADRLLAPHFDTEYAARIALGTYWRDATAAQRQRFAAALYQSLLRTYAAAVTEWSADRVRLVPLHADAAALQVVVRTLVTRTSGGAAPVDYRLRKTVDGWKIYDVIVEGVSYMRNYHDDIDGEIAQHGLDATTARLEATRRRGASTAPITPRS
jgi:phospholipid transport system substrate-binding protein